MCGRSAQTQTAVYAAAASLRIRGGGGGSGSDNGGEPTTTSTTTTTTTNSGFASNSTTIPNRHHQQDYEWTDNYNLAPGMSAMVFFKDENDGQIRMEPKVWGLVTRGGTKNQPLPTGTSMMAQHFQAHMFNARSDTLYERSTFARLASMGRSCLVALDGFFEWKTLLKGDKKQPYFVKRNKNNNDDQQQQQQQQQQETTKSPTDLIRQQSPQRRRLWQGHVGSVRRRDGAPQQSSRRTATARSDRGDEEFVESALDDVLQSNTYR
mmetsp:Transcript_18677/g.51113  ORF Transcript_18677/g.51113 Transcript_18677/m.51113 type:complete len:265 (+) Transcript_18677:41-835(+)